MCSQKGVEYDPLLELFGCSQIQCLQRLPRQTPLAAMVNNSSQAPKVPHTLTHIALKFYGKIKKCLTEMLSLSYNPSRLKLGGSRLKECLVHQILLYLNKNSSQPLIVM